MSDELLIMKGITKIYPNGIIANNHVDFSVKEGEIHALMGENGAGKSTLMNILFGELQAEEGDIYLKGEKIKITSPTEAIAYGIGMVHQHFMLVPSLTVAENIFLGMEPRKRGLIDRRKMLDKTKEIAQKYNFDIDPMSKVSDIPVGMKQKIEILKSLARSARILVLDEPTAVLTPQETDELFNELRLFKESGHTIIFISHKLKEIKKICDRITIMKNGVSMGTYELQEMDEKDISRLMVGRDIVSGIQKEAAKPGKVVLRVEELTCSNDEGKQTLNRMSFTIRTGEILGIAGVEGNGQLELVECITGLRDNFHGKILIEDKEINRISIKNARRLGLSHIPEDRMTFGIASDASIAENLISDKLGEQRIGIGPFLSQRKIKDFTDKLIKDFLIKCSSGKQPARMLSGGNMQKVVIAREFSGNPRVMIANQPSRGVDVGATEFIHKKLVQIRDQGAAVLLVSADLNEVIELSDSLIVMYGGEIVAYFKAAKKINEEELGYFMLGLKKQSQEEVRGAIYA